MEKGRFEIMSLNPVKTHLIMGVAGAGKTKRMAEIAVDKAKEGKLVLVVLQDETPIGFRDRFLRETTDYSRFNIQVIGVKYSADAIHHLLLRVFQSRTPDVVLVDVRLKEPMLGIWSDIFKRLNIEGYLAQQLNVNECDKGVKVMEYPYSALLNNSKEETE